MQWLNGVRGIALHDETRAFAALVRPYFIGTAPILNLHDRMQKSIATLGRLAAVGMRTLLLRLAAVGIRRLLLLNGRTGSCPRCRISLNRQHAM